MDILAKILNEEYQLGLRSDNVDLSKEKFMAELSSKKATIAENIQRFKTWINQVVEHRTKIIHRTQATLPYYADKTFASAPQIPNESLSLTEHAVVQDLREQGFSENQAYRRIGKKGILTFLPAEAFYQEYMTNTCSLFEFVSEDFIGNCEAGMLSKFPFKFKVEVTAPNL